MIELKSVNFLLTSLKFLVCQSTGIIRSIIHFKYYFLAIFLAFAVILLSYSQMTSTNFLIACYNINTTLIAHTLSLSLCKIRLSLSSFLSFLSYISASTTSL